MYLNICVQLGVVSMKACYTLGACAAAATDGGLLIPREGNLCECKRVSITRSHVMAPASDVPTIWPGIRAGM